nr:MAG TPA: hypothetical protein [Caudoviricetes sp.]
MAASRGDPSRIIWLIQGTSLVDNPDLFIISRATTSRKA